jgi:hypothetical protein
MPHQNISRALTVGGVAPGVRTATFDTDSFINDDADFAVLTVVASAASGTSPTLNAKVQYSPDNGTTWIDLDTTNGVTPNLTAAGSQDCRYGPGLPVTAAKSANVPLPRLLRVRVTIGGTTPSFTISGIYFQGV